MFRRCLIANRGEIAVRIIRACRELGIAPVAVYSDADAGALHVALADEAHRLGPPPPPESYLHRDRLLAAAQAAGCDCVHPGYGFLSENEAFAQAVMDAGLTWIGPGPRAIRLMGLKTEARALMQAAGVPLPPGFQPEAATLAEYEAAAAALGYPVLVKAAAGGGGRGIRSVKAASELAEALAAAQREAQHAFGDGRVFLEKVIQSARHIEMQVLADAHGHTVHLFERECSAQRRRQKIIEETPSPLLDAVTRAAMGAAAVAAAQAVGYVNAGTVEFIATPERAFYFLEMNTRLQVEHPVTELVTGLDLVKLQFRIAAGEALPFSQEQLTQRGHAIECRLYAEDPESGFLPAPGPLLALALPSGPGVRVDSGVRGGDTISLHYDPMIAKLIVHDSDRPAALRRMQAALAQTVVLGTRTNLAFLQALLAHPAFQAGTVDTSFVETHLHDLMPREDEDVPDAALLAAALLDMAAGGPATATAGASAGPPSPWGASDSYRVGS